MNWHEHPQPESTRASGAGEDDPLWLTSQFSTAELEGRKVLVRWMRRGTLESSDVYVMHCGTYGHSRHIQSIRLSPVDDQPGRADFQFDQTDADCLHRTNENPREFSFAAELEMERTRTQSRSLEKLVLERRAKKLEDEHGGRPLGGSKAH